MSDITNITLVNPTTVASAPVAQTSATKPTTPFTVQTATSSAEKPQTRVTDNPLAKVLVTQFYDGSGDISAQLPSSTVIAYLENGLDTNGVPKSSIKA
jgi:hypothetical protein